jgi:hypothetical protein
MGICWVQWVPTPERFMGTSAWLPTYCRYGDWCSVADGEGTGCPFTRPDISTFYFIQVACGPWVGMADGTRWMRLGWCRCGFPSRMRDCAARFPGSEHCRGLCHSAGTDVGR